MFERDRKLTALQYKTLTKKGTPFIEREHSVRGLESFLDETESSLLARTSHRVSPLSANEDANQHVRLVLEEQKRQRAAGSYPNPFIFREVSTKSSKDAKKKSAALGEADALSGYVSSSRALQRRSMGVVHSISRKIH
jgi:predicted acylesterase/phospholipase RssA